MSSARWKAFQYDKQCQQYQPPTRTTTSTGHDSDLTVSAQTRWFYLAIPQDHMPCNFFLVSLVQSGLCSRTLQYSKKNGSQERRSCISTSAALLDTKLFLALKNSNPKHLNIPQSCGWRCVRQGFVILSIMDSELYQSTDAAVLLESVGVLMDELWTSGKGAARRRHAQGWTWELAHETSAGVQCVPTGTRQNELLKVDHIQGAFERADLSTKAHSKARLWALLKMWRIANLRPEAETLLFFSDVGYAMRRKGFGPRS